jgi:hypothetical protein
MVGEARTKVPDKNTPDFLIYRFHGRENYRTYFSETTEASIRILTSLSGFTHPFFNREEFVIHIFSFFYLISLLSFQSIAPSGA